jgi:hypothetical protein
VVHRWGGAFLDQWRLSVSSGMHLGGGVVGWRMLASVVAANPWDRFEFLFKVFRIIILSWFVLSFTRILLLVT